jgi:hypothetical protein
MKALWSADAQGRLTYCDAVTRDCSGQLLSCWQSWADDRNDYQVVVRVRDDEGHYRLCEGTGEPLRSAGKLIGWRGTCELGAA